MSAYILNDINIDVLIKSTANILKNTYGYKLYTRFQTFDLWEDSERNALGNILKAQNYASVNYRYKDNAEYMAECYQPTPEYIYRDDVPVLDPIAIIKICNCYDYQSCETPNYESTLPARIIDSIRSHMITNLPGYDSAKWGL